MTTAVDIDKVFETHDANMAQLSEAIAKSGGSPLTLVTPEIRKFFFALARSGVMIAADCHAPTPVERVIKRRKPRSDAGKARGKLVRSNGDKPASLGATDD